MRVLFDTSVLVDGYFVASSPSRRAFVEARNQRIELFTSASILGELEWVMRTKFRIPALVAEDACRGLSARLNVRTVEVTDLPTACPGDPLDDHVLAAAVKAGAEMVVSTDKHLLSMGTYQRIPVVTPEQFLLRIKVVPVKTYPPARYRRPALKRPSLPGLAA